jgi:hypothetical protein
MVWVAAFAARAAAMPSTGITAIAMLVLSLWIVIQMTG